MECREFGLVRGASQRPLPTVSTLRSDPETPFSSLALALFYYEAEN